MTRLRLLAGLVGLFCLTAAAGWWIAGHLSVPPAKTAASNARKTAPPSTHAPAAAVPTDADRWLTAVAECVSPSAQCRAAADLAAALDPRDFERMLGRADELPLLGAREFFISGILRRWVAADPEKALEWCQKSRPELLPYAIGAWTGRDPKAAEAYIVRMDRDSVDAAAIGFLKSLAQTDPAAAYAAVAAHPTWNPFVATAAVETLANTDPQRLLASLDSLPAGLRPVARQAAAVAMAGKDFSAAMAWILQQPDVGPLIRGALKAAPDPKSAVEAWMKIPKEAGESALPDSAYAIARKDPAGALKALGALGLLDPGSKGHHIAGPALAAIAQSDPQEAVRLLGNLNLPPSWHPHQGIAEAWAETDSQAALAWARSLPEGTIDPESLQKLTALANPPAWDPSPTGRYLALCKASGPRPNAARIVETPEQRAAVMDALANPESFPAGSPADMRISPFLTSFPDECAAWALRQPPSDQRDKDLANAMQSWGTIDPRSASAWVTGTLPASLQPPAITQILESWQAMDPDGAKAWFRALPENVRKEVKAPGKDW